MQNRILYVLHNHPDVVPGGAEAYGYELYQAMKESQQFEPLLLARTGPPHTSRALAHQGTLLGGVNGDPNQYFFHTDIAGFDWLLQVARDKESCVRFYRDFLTSYRPDVVHFQHTLFFGFDFLLETRNTLPDARIVYTLHEYLPICHRNGQMLRTRTNDRCLEASPQRCHACFPDITPQSFFMRQRFIASHLNRVDQFVAPSRFLLERYVDWGIPREKLMFEEYGRLPMHRARVERKTSHRFGFFGQLNLFKGINVLLEAMRLLDTVAGPDAQTTGTPHLWVHGANLEFSAQEFRDEFQSALKAAGDRVTFVGKYPREHLPHLMANVDWVVVPSIWWENSPLVIQEAFAHGKPVICSDIGGMAEKVADGVNGLHFRANDAVSLAETLWRAAATPGLHERLERGITAVHSMREHRARLERLYVELMQTR